MTYRSHNDKLFALQQNNFKNVYIEIELGDINDDNPFWKEDIDICAIQIKNLNYKLNSLLKVQTNAMKDLVFNLDETETDLQQDTKSIVLQIDSQIRECSSLLKKMNSDEYFKKIKNKSYIKIVNNISRHYVEELNNITIEFRTIQKRYEKNMGHLNKINSRYITHSDNDNHSDSDNPFSYSNPQFTQEQINRIEEEERMMEERNKDILKIENNVKELAVLMNDLMTLVVDQSVMIDRIDNYVEETVVNIEQGLTELKKADKQQEIGSNAGKCICFLVTLIFIMLLIITIKEQNDR